MNTGRIVELTLAVGAGGVAACSASGSHNGAGCAISSSMAQP